MLWEAPSAHHKRNFLVQTSILGEENTNIQPTFSLCERRSVATSDAFT